MAIDWTKHPDYKKNWKTGLNNNKDNPIFIQDLEKESYKHDNHYRCKICNYSNMGSHDKGLIVHTGPMYGRAMFKEKGTEDFFCENCIGYTKFRIFSEMSEFQYKNTNYKPIKFPKSNDKDEKPIFDETNFGMNDKLEGKVSKVFVSDEEQDPWEKIFNETISNKNDPWVIALAETSEEYSDEEWDLLEDFVEENKNPEWEEIIKEDGEDNEQQEKQINIPLFQGYSQMDPTKDY